MIVDASALLAIAFNEEDSRRFLAAMSSAPRLRMAAANWLEAAMVVDRRGRTGASGLLDRIVERLALEIAPLRAEHVARARWAWGTYGKGRHPARLNFGDCMAYGFATVEGESLLFKGDDFSRTDITPALPA